MNGNIDNNLNFLMGTQGNYGGYPNQGMDPMMGNQNMYGQNPYANNYGGPQVGGLDFLMGGATPNQNMGMGGDFNNSAPQTNLDPFLGVSNDNSNDDKGETLFGVPMYDEKREEKKVDESNLFAPDNSAFAPPPQQGPYGYPGMPMGNDYGLGNMPPIIHDDNNMNMSAPNNETLFGAPMYDTNSNANQMDTSGNRTDIFGQLLTPEGNMRITGGRIVDDFSKVNIPPQDGNLMQQMNQPYGYPNPGMDPMMGNQNMYGGNQFGNNTFGMNQNPYMNNNQFGMNQNPYGNNNFGMNQNPYGNQNNFGMNQNPYMNNNQFGMNQNPYGMGMGMNMYPGYGMPRGPVFNELKVEDNLNQNIVKDLPEEEHTETKPAEKEKPTPRVDLNLETGNEDKEEFYE